MCIIHFQTARAARENTTRRVKLENGTPYVVPCYSSAFEISTTFWRRHIAPMEIDSMFDPTGLKEIGNLASWTVSTSKPGCGVEELRDEDTNLFWQYVVLVCLCALLCTNIYKDPMVLNHIISTYTSLASSRFLQYASTSTLKPTNHIHLLESLFSLVPVTMIWYLFRL